MEYRRVRDAVRRGGPKIPELLAADNANFDRWNIAEQYFNGKRSIFLSIRRSSAYLQWNIAAWYLRKSATYLRVTARTIP
jgi:hypothetical protein